MCDNSSAWRFILKNSTKNFGFKHKSGILMPVSSLPSPYGIGSFGKGAFDFVDFLAETEQKCWQVLPLNPTSYGDSPYQSPASAAGNPYFIDLDLLAEDGLLTAAELKEVKFKARRVDYGRIYFTRYEILRTAYSRFKKNAAYMSFCSKNAHWLEDYALFMALKVKNGWKAWVEWEENEKVARIARKNAEKYEDESGFWKWIQFEFFTQWKKLADYAHEKGIQIIGDMPLFVSLGSADVWANQRLFQLDSKGYPIEVAGVPPDYFSETGQLWGNPLYAWKEHEKNHFKWWVARVRHQLQLCDYLRIDHFRGLESYWAVPYGEETAINGKWLPGPGADLFFAIEDALGKGLPIIAEDLGMITPEVEALRDQFEFPGMKILQFAFDSEEESTFLPHQFTTVNCVCYTGTHDNNTTKGWYASASEYSRDKVRCYMNTDGSSIHWDFLRTCLGSIATYAIIPMQDVLGIGEEGRMNTPGVGTDNWAWRYDKHALSDGLAEGLKKITRIYGR
jgi:4-alpha-glucanotransferase